MNNTIIRWLGAFRKVGSLDGSFKWELANMRKYRKGLLYEEIAAEIIRGNSKSHIQAKVGLVVRGTSARRKFHCDAWSEKKADGTLKATSPHHTPHSEAFCAPDYVGVTIKGQITKKSLKIVKYWAKLYDLPIIGLKEVQY